MGLEVEVVADTHKFDVIIVGGSLAGMLASISLKGKNINCAFLEKSIPGGKLRETAKIENFMNIPTISGLALCDQIFKHAVNDLKVPYFYANVQTIKQQPNNKFYLYSDSGKVWEAKIVIFACRAQTEIISQLNQLKLTNNNLIVDKNLETNLKNFYAIGPAINYLTANKQMQSATVVSDIVAPLLKTNND